MITLSVYHNLARSFGTDRQNNNPYVVIKTGALVVETYFMTLFIFQEYSSYLKAMLV